MADKRLLLLVFLLALGKVFAMDYSFPNSGTEFHFMFMPNDQIDDGEVPASDPYYIIVCNPGPTNNHVEIRYSDVAISFFVPPLESNNYVFPMEVMEHVMGATPLGIYLKSTFNVTVIVVNRQQFTTDTYNILPKTSLSLSYIAACFGDKAQNGNGKQDSAEYPVNFFVNDLFDRSQIGIVGVLNATEVDITLPIYKSGEKVISVEYKGIFYTNAPGGKESFRVKLDEHQTYLLSSAGDLTGTLIRGNRRIAVFSGNNRARVDGKTRDHLVEQMIPLNSWLNEWYISSTPNRTMGDRYRLLTSSLGGSWVNITLNNGTNFQNLRIESSRSFLEILLPSGIYAKFTCSQRCLVYQIARSTSGKELGDPSGVVAANPDVYGAYRYIFKTPDAVNGQFPVNRMVIMSRLDVLPVFLENNAQIVPNITWDCSQYINMCSGQWEISTNGTVLILVDTYPVGIWLYGNADRNSYAHLLGLQIYSPACLGPDRDLLRPGDVIDNDCDSNTDEEPNAFDGLDNDGDGAVDEDVNVGFKASDSIGKDYLIMFMENWVEMASDIPLEVFIAGLSQENATVSIDFPMENDTRVTNITTVPGRAITKVEFGSYLMQHGTGIKSKAIRIRSNSNIAVFGMNKQVYSTDGFLAIPITAFGTEYRTVSYYPATLSSQIGIVAASDGTLVSITFPPADGKQALDVQYEGVSYTNGATLNVTMNAYDSLQLQDINSKGDLSGSLIRSNRPVGVFSGNIRTFVQFNNIVLSGSRDHLVEQLPPIASWGKQFAMFSIPERTVGDVYKIVASQINTNVVITTRRASTSYSTTIILPHAGSNYQHSLNKSQSYLYVMSDKPILVVHITRSQQTVNNMPVCDPLPEEGQVWESNCAGDPSMIYIPPIELYSNRYIFMTPRISNKSVSIDYTHWLMVIAEQSFVSNLTLNDNTTFFRDAVWEPIPAPSSASHGALMATAVKLTLDTQYHLYHTDSKARIMGILYGYGDRESYGFPIGLNFQRCDQSLSMPGDGVDNDCDGRIDEELCSDGEDNDKDGLTDEDCYKVVTRYKYLAVFMENYVEYPGYYPPRLHTASQECQDVLVTVPRYTYDGSSDVIAQHVCGSKQLNIGLRPDVRHVGSGIQHKGIVVESYYPIDIFGSNIETFSSDAFTLIPSHLLGNEYITAHYNSRAPFAPEQFAITTEFNETSITVQLSPNLTNPALDHKTSVTTCPSSSPNTVQVQIIPNTKTSRRGHNIEFDGATYGAGSTINFILNGGESAQIQSFEGSLTGTRIISDKSIAVFSGNVRTWVESDQLPSESRDHLVEQLLPRDGWGNIYSAPASPGRNLSDIFIISNPYSFSLDVHIFNEVGAEFRVNVTASGSLQLSLPSGNSKFHVFKAKGFFQVLRVTWSQIVESEQTDPSLLLLVPFWLWKNSYTFSLPMLSGGDGGGNKANTILQLFSPWINITEIQINGKSLEAQWFGITFTDVWAYYANIELDSSIEQWTISSKEPFMATLYGSADRESFAMPCGYYH